MPTKSDFNKIFNELRKWGYTVINFSDKRALRRGMKDWVDYVIFNENNICFIELKIGDDKLSEGQSDTKSKLQSLTENTFSIRYYEMKEIEQAKSIVLFLIENKNG